MNTEARNCFVLSWTVDPDGDERGQRRDRCAEERVRQRGIGLDMSLRTVRIDRIEPKRRSETSSPIRFRSASRDRYLETFADGS